MKKLIVIILCIVIGVLLYMKNDEIIIPSDAIRVRIIANSNTIKDLYEKRKIKEEIKRDLYEITKEAKSSLEADKKISTSLDYINSLVSSKTDNYNINYGLNYFPKKIYKGVIYPEGEYQSLVITLGEGLGDNWWCVLYPPLCMIEDNSEADSVEYRLLISDILNN